MGEDGADVITTTRIEATPLGQEQRQRQWDDKRAELQRVTDGLGRPIDEGILETVVALNLIGIPTDGSCEGHIDSGEGAPWVTFATQEGTPLLQSVQEIKSKARAIEKENGRDVPEALELYDKAYEQRRAAERPGLELQAKLMHYLGKFYADRHVPYDSRLVIQGNFEGGVLQSQGAPLQQIVSEHLKSEQLQAYQAEMRAFTDFLQAEYIAS